MEELVFEAIEEFNKTMKKRGLWSHLEKEGIFYNTLRRVFSLRVPGFNFRNTVRPDHFKCVFRDNGEIKSYSYRPSYISPYRENFDLIRTLKDVGEHFSDLDSSVTLLRISKLVNSLKHQ